MDGQNSSLGILNSILNIECASTSELNGFAAMNMFPTAEIAAIRKEFKSFKEYQETIMVRNNRPVDGSKASDIAMVKATDDPDRYMRNRSARGKPLLCVWRSGCQSYKYIYTLPMM